MWGIQMPFSGPLVQFHHKTIDLLPLWGAKPWTKQLLKGLCQAGNELLIWFWKGTASEIMILIIYINELEDDAVKKIPSLENAIFWSATMSVEIMKSNKCKFRLICLWTKSPEREYFQSRKGRKQGVKLLPKFPTVSLLRLRKKEKMPRLPAGQTQYNAPIKGVALSLLEMCAQYNMPFISYLGWTVNYSNTISYATPQKDSEFHSLIGRGMYVCSSFLCTSSNASCFPLATYIALFPHQQPPSLH